MDEEDITSCQPIYNLPILSKLIEKIMARRIEHNIQINAQGKDHSVEIAVIEVHSDISDSIDDGSMAALVLLDLSPEFDIADDILVRCLECSFGTENEALSSIF